MSSPYRHDLEIRMRPVAELTPWSRNPRKNDRAAERLAYTIAEHGWTNPILLDRGGQIVAGHTRLKAALRLGLTEVPTITLDAEGHEAAAIAIADNRLAEMAEWDDAGLASLLAELDGEGIDLEGVGYDAAELSEALAAIDPPELPQAPEPEEPPEEPDSRFGEVYELGPHRLICGDSTESTTWDALDLNTSAAVFTSPPYNLTSSDLSGNREHQSRGSAYIEPERPWMPMMNGWIRCALERCCTVSVNVQMLAGNKRQLVTWAAEWADHLVDVAAWDKGHGPPQMAENVMTNVFEFVFIFGAPGSSRAIPSASFKGTEGNVYRGAPQRQNKYAAIHGATFPIDFATWGVSVLCAKASLVVDPFAGTGTTLMACALDGKIARLIELDPRYCDVIRRRWTAWADEAGVDAGPGALR